MDLEGRVRVEDGAAAHARTRATPQPSAGARLIIDEAMKDDPRPLYVAFLGPLTDMASALLMEPRDRGAQHHASSGSAAATGRLAGASTTCSNDIHAANVVMKSKVQLWQIPMTVYRMMAVGYAELCERVYDKGADRQVSRRAACRMEPQECTPGPSSIARSAIRRRSASFSIRMAASASGWPAPEFNSLDELRAYGQQPADQGLPHHRHSLHPGGLLRQAVPLHPRRTGIGQLRSETLAGVTDVTQHIIDYGLCMF